MHGKGAIAGIIYLSNNAASYGRSGGETVGKSSTPATTMRTGDASESNQIYGASDTVQPVSVRKRWFVQVANAVETTAYQNVDIALQSKVNKSGDTMTGALSVPTPASGSNNTTVPTTAWVRSYGVSKTGDTMTGSLKFDKSLAAPIIFKYDDESDDGIRIGRDTAIQSGEPVKTFLIEVDGLVDQYFRIDGWSGQVMIKRSPGETSNTKELTTTEWVRTLLSFKSTGSVTIAEGNLSIAGDYVLTNLPENTIPKLAFISCRIALPGQGGSTSIAVSSSICEAIRFCQTNNGFGSSGFVLLPVGTDRKISISFPETSAGLSLATVTLLGYI